MRIFWNKWARCARMPDFDAMWSALDADGSGEIDFVVRPKIVHNEIYSYFVHGHSHSLCHIIIKCFYRSLQLSLVAVGMSLTRLARNRMQWRKLKSSSMHHRGSPPGCWKSRKTTMKKLERQMLWPLRNKMLEMLWLPRSRAAIAGAVFKIAWASLSMIWWRQDVKTRILITSSLKIGYRWLFIPRDKDKIDVCFFVI